MPLHRLDLGTLVHYRKSLGVIVSQNRARLKKSLACQSFRGQRIICPQALTQDFRSVERRMAEHDENPLVVELQTLRTEALARVDDIADLTALDTWRIDYLGRRGALTQVMRGIGTSPCGAAATGRTGVERGEDDARRGV